MYKRQDKNKGSSAQYWFGTDNLGRDLFSRIWVGARASILIAIVATILKLVVGTLYGAAMAHFGGWVDDVLMRIIEVINSVPYLLVTILIMMVLGNNLFALLIALSITAWCNTARQTRGMIKQLKESEYVYAAEVLGAKPSRIILKHYIPNMLSILILDASTAIPQFIFTEAGLSFLGIGLKAPAISLGVLISQGQQTMDFYPAQLFYPCLLYTSGKFPLADSKCLTLFNHSSYNGGKIFSFFDINFAFRVNCLYMAFVIVPGFHAFSASFLDK